MFLPYPLAESLHALLEQQRSELIGIEAHEQPVSAAHGRRPQIAGRADQMLHQLGIAGRSGPHFKVDHPLPLGDVDVLGRTGQFHRIARTEPDFGGIDLLIDRDI